MKNMKFEIKTKHVLYGIAIILILVWILAFMAEKRKGIRIGEILIDLNSLFCKFIIKGDDGTSKLYDYFVQIWGIAITIMIFIIELAGNIKYGVSLKRIAVLILGKVQIYIIAGIYLFLYPLAYVFLLLNWEYMLFSCWLTAVVGLGVTLFFCVRNTRGKSVQEILKKNTIKVLKEKHQNNNSLSLPKKYSVRSEIDSLSITDMIIHTDFSNMEEMRNSTTILTELLTNHDVQKCLQGTFMEHTILMNWTMRICQSFDLAEEWKRQVLLEVLKNMWTELKEYSLISYDNSVNHEKIISYSIQIMIPLMILDNNQNHNLVSEFLSEIYGYQKESMVYLLMYMEYRYWTYDSCLMNLFINSSSQFPDMIDIFYDIVNGNFVFNYKLALSLWLDWSQYDYQLNDMRLKEFQQFADVAKQMIGGKSCHNSRCFVLEYLMLVWGK